MIWSAIYGLGFFGMYLILFPFQALFLLTGWHRAAHFLNIVWGYWAFIWGLCRLVRIRKGKVPKGTYIYVANHRSYIDIPAGHVTFGRFFRYIAKSELADAPLFGFMYRRLHIMLDRSSPMARARSLQLAANALRKKESLFIFPEGTTKHADPMKLGRFHEGAFTLAIREKVPIVPVTFCNTRRMLSADGKFRVRPFVKIKAIINEPIQTKDLSLEDVTTLSDKVKNLIQQQLVEYEN